MPPHGRATRPPGCTTLLLQCIIFLAIRWQRHYVAMQQRTQEADLATPPKPRTAKAGARRAPVAVTKAAVTKAKAKPPVETPAAAQPKPVVAEPVAAEPVAVDAAPPETVAPATLASAEPVVPPADEVVLSAEEPVADEPVPVETPPSVAAATPAVLEAVIEPEPEPEPVIEPATPPPAAPSDDLPVVTAGHMKGPSTMTDAIETAKTFAEEAKTRIQSAFTEVNEKTKAAMEKSAKAFEEFGELTKGNLEAVVESSKIAAKGVESIGQEAAEFGRKSFEKTSSTMKSFAAVKTPTEFFQLQGELVSQTLDSLASVAAKNSEAMLKLAGDISQPISNRVSVVTEKMKSLAA